MASLMLRTCKFLNYHGRRKRNGKGTTRYIEKNKSGLYSIDEVNSAIKREISKTAKSLGGLTIHFKED